MRNLGIIWLQLCILTRILCKLNTSVNGLSHPFYCWSPCDMPSLDTKQCLVWGKKEAKKKYTIEFFFASAKQNHLIHHLPAHSFA